jgi:hypothetical protein
MRTYKLVVVMIGLSIGLIGRTQPQIQSQPVPAVPVCPMCSAAKDPVVIELIDGPAELPMECPADRKCI